MKKSTNIPHTFVLDELEKLSPYTKPMFGFTGVYVGEKIVFALREREKFPEDNGVWIATFRQHQESLSKILPSMRSLIEFGPEPTDWQVIPTSSQTFEEEVVKACELVKKNDPRIGKVPASRKPKAKKKPKVKARKKKSS